MSSGIVALPVPAAPEARAPGRASFGARVGEFMVVGGATLVLLPLCWLLRKGLGLDDAELSVGFLTFYAAYLINDPHFAVTYLLFYRDAHKRVLSTDTPLAQRARYVASGLLVPLGLVAWAVLALRAHSAQALGWMIQLMFLLVGSHYVKQGFGVLTVLSARRGVRLSARERAVILFHCYAGWAYAWASPAAAAGEFEEKGVVYRALAHPRWLEVATGAVFAASTLALVVLLAGAWLRERRLLPLAPLGGLLITVWSWTIYSSFDPLLRYMIPALHSVQYLYFVWLMKRNEARECEGPPTFGKPVAVRLGFLAVGAIGLALVLFRGAPSYLDGIFTAPPARGAVPDALGETPFFAAIFVVVNIHHYFMDTVLWRRDNPDTRYLRDG